MINSRKEIKEYLIKILSNVYPKGLVIAIKGKWGTGKTFFIKEELFQELSANSCIKNKTSGKQKTNNNFNMLQLKSYLSFSCAKKIYEKIKANLMSLVQFLCVRLCKKKYVISKRPLQEKEKTNHVYISLFGKENIEEVTRDIVLQLFSFNKGISAINKIMKNLSGSMSYKGISISFSTSLLSTILSLMEKKDFRDIIIAIDDLERTEIDIEEILGLINQLKEEKDCKVILICNEDKIQDKNYKKYKEKCIDIEILFRPSFEENFSLLKEIIQGKQEFIFNIMKRYFKEIKANGHEEVNFRILNYIYFKLNELSFIQNEIQIDEYWKNAIFMTMTFLFYIKKHQDLTIGSIDELMDYLKKDSSKNKENLEQTKLLKPNKFDEFVSVIKNEQFFIKLLHFWETEVITESLKKSIIKDINSFYKKIKNISDISQKRNIIRNMYIDYLTNLNYDKYNFVKKVWSFLEENQTDLLAITDINRIIFLLKKLIEFDPKNKREYQEFAIKMFKNYIAWYGDDFVFDSQSDLYDVKEKIERDLELERDKLEEIVIDVKQKYLNKSFKKDCNEIFTDLKTIIGKQGWNYSELKIIKLFPKEKLKKCFLETGDLSLIAHFFKYKSRSNRFENFKIILREILDELEQESDYNEKILELKKYLGIDTQ